MSIFSLLHQSNRQLSESTLYSERDFYKQFYKDMRHAIGSVYIESPFIASARMERLLPKFEELLDKGVRITLVTRDPVEYDDEFMRDQATNEILRCVETGIEVNLMTGFHHRKLAIIDDTILWEGSLNILSNGKSKEIMRRIEDRGVVSEMKRFLLRQL